MDYFTYLRLRGLTDNEDSFIEYLIDIQDYTLEDAKRFARFMFNNKEED